MKGNGSQGGLVSTKRSRWLCAHTERPVVEKCLVKADVSSFTLEIKFASMIFFLLYFMGMWKVEQTGTKQGLSIWSTLEANVWMGGFLGNTVAVSCTLESTG